MLCFLIPLGSGQQGGREENQKGVEDDEDDEGEGLMFSHRREADGWAQGAFLYIYMYVNGFISALSLKAQRE